MYYYIINLVCFYIGKFFGGYDALSIHWNGFDYTVTGKGLDGLLQMGGYLNYCNNCAKTVLITFLVITVVYLAAFFIAGVYCGYTGKEIEEA